MKTPEIRLYQQSRRADLVSLSVTAERQHRDPGSRATASDPLDDALRQVREKLARDHADLLRDREGHRDALLSTIREELHGLPLTSDERRLAYDLLSTDYFGFGRLDEYMRDPNVTEIIVDGPEHVDVEVNGQLHRVKVRWANDASLREYIKGLIRDSGRPLDTAHPIVDCELGGARINATAPPVSKHYTLNIRKSVEQTKRYTPEEYVGSGAINPSGMRLLLALARGAATILVCGPTGTGKTTLARILIEAGARADLRWLVLEDVRETEAQVDRFVSLQAVERRENPVTIADLFSCVKRKRPDRIAVGEVRSGEHALPFVMTTLAGHDGPITTMHAGTEYDALFNFVFFLKMAGLPVNEEFLERMLHRQLNILVFVHRFRDGRRRVTRIVEVLPLEDGGTGFSVLMEWNKDTDSLEWRNPISPGLTYRLDLAEVVVPKPGEEVTADTLRALDTFAPEEPSLTVLRPPEKSENGEKTTRAPGFRTQRLGRRIRR